ncbi:hypothetical protein [Kaistia sp. MMO-174]|uniref:hypothetical protein n=1 Tax=Kaistia sp. MMO-174 TaxID=3081256 RepID=UPI003017F142
MRTNDENQSRAGRRERATRGAFYLWMAAYAAVVVAIVTVHAMSGNPSKPDDEHLQQAIRAGVSYGTVIPVVQVDVNG